MVDDSIEHFRAILRQHSLGIEFRVNKVMDHLNKLGLDLTDQNNATVINDPFLARLRRVVMNHVLRDIKHKGRIPVPKSYQLVGVADEGPAYKAKGLENVFILPEGQIFGKDLSFLTQLGFFNEFDC
jgi:RNA-dependent RNA polymerase